MKIAIINTTLQYGSVGKIAYGLYRKLILNGHEVRIYYGRIDDPEDNNCKKISSQQEVYLHVLLARLTGLQGFFSAHATRKLIRDLEAYCPDIIQLYNLHGYYLNEGRLLRYIADKDIPMVYTMLDEYPYLGRCCYSYGCYQFQTGCRNCQMRRKEYPATWLLRNAKKHFRNKKKAYDRIKRSCYVGPEYVIKRAEESLLLAGKKMYIVDEYVDTENRYFPKKEFCKIDPGIILSEKIKVLCVAPYSDPRKGGAFFFEMINGIKEKERYLFIYIGMDEKKVAFPESCIVKGYVYDQDEMAEYYSIADLFVCTSLSDTMPNTCLESMACGTPIVGFDNTGIPYLAPYPIGQYVRDKSITELLEVVEKSKKKSTEISKKCRSYALERYSPDTYYKKMISIYEDLTH